MATSTTRKIMKINDLRKVILQINDLRPDALEFNSKSQRR